REFQRHVVVVVEIIEADHLIAARQQTARGEKADEPGCAGDQKFHAGRVLGFFGAVRMIDAARFELWMANAMAKRAEQGSPWSWLGRRASIFSSSRLGREHRSVRSSAPEIPPERRMYLPPSVPGGRGGLG